MPAQTAKFDVGAIRRKFPALKQNIDGKTPVYLDNPGGTQVPQMVMEEMRY
jgi:selenocysteine lyase/cysteine desulfurase